MSDRKTLHISEDLEARLSPIAGQSGHTLDELADAVLRAHADEQERGSLEKAEDERRWQRYLETGQTVSLDTVRRKLHTLADDATGSAETR